MTRHVAFLRGINLGNRRLMMDELRGHFQALGLEDVATYLASGNVVFGDDPSDPAALERRIEAHLEATLGYPVATFLRPLAALERVVSAETLEGVEEEGFRPQVLFLRETPGNGVRAALAELEGPDDRFRPLDREVVWLRRGGLKASPISTRELNEALGGEDHTMRTLNTVRRIVGKFGT